MRTVTVLEYLVSLHVAAVSAAAPDSRAYASTYDSADVQMTVTSQTTGLRACLPCVMPWTSLF